MFSCLSIWQVVYNGNSEEVKCWSRWLTDELLNNNHQKNIPLSCFTEYDNMYLLGLLSDFIFSRRFMKWNATIIVTLFSIHTNWPKQFYGILMSQIESFGLANWIKKVFSLFLPRNIQYRERLKGPLPVFFRHCETFFEKNPQRVPLQFFMYCSNGC